MEIVDMRCARCNHPMKTAAASITTRNGLCCVGPRCARFMGLLIATAKVPKTKTRRLIRCVEVQDDQIALEGFA